MVFPLEVEKVLGYWWSGLGHDPWAETLFLRASSTRRHFHVGPFLVLGNLSYLVSLVYSQV